MKRITLIAIVIFTISSCKLIDDQIGCSEFYVKNELSSTVFLRSYKLIDSGFYFTLDSFELAPNQLIRMNQDCRIGDVTPYPIGKYTKFTFANNKTKLDTFSGTGSVYLNDSINIYNNALWKNDTVASQRLRKATYFINAKDSLEAR